MTSTNKIPCTCAHEEMRHHFRDRSVKDILLDLARKEQKDVEVIRDMNSMEPKGFVLCGKTYTYAQALTEVENVRELESRCKEVFCKCPVYRSDNLRYLERKYGSKTTRK